MDKTQKTKQCYANMHLSPIDFAFYQLFLNITEGGKRTLFFNGRTFEKFFKLNSVKKSTFYSRAKSLMEQEWLEPLNFVKKGKLPRKGDGTMAPLEFRVRTHQQWVKEISSKQCRDMETLLVQPDGLEDDEPVQNNEGTSPKQPRHQSKIAEAPVQLTGHIFIEEKSSIKDNLLRENLKRAEALKDQNVQKEENHKSRQDEGELSHIGIPVQSTGQAPVHLDGQAPVQSTGPAQPEPKSSGPEPELWEQLNKDNSNTLYLKYGLYWRLKASREEVQDLIRNQSEPVEVAL